MNKALIGKITAVFVGMMMIFAAGTCAGYYMDTEYDIEPLDMDMLVSSGIENADKLMITAHPDDEILWGGGHLFDKGYFIVVITNGKNEIRSNEFRNVLKESGNNGIILDYPDKTFGKRDDWSQVSGRITDDLRLIMESKPWKLIVTHNPEGEYGHIHHVMTDKIVTDIYDDELKNTDTRLYYFGKYYKKSDLPDAESRLSRMSDERIEYKESLLKLYSSQSKTIDKLSHMDPYEEWTEAE